MKMADDTSAQAVQNVTRENITPEELMDVYKTWANNYDKDNYEKLLSAGPSNITAELHRYLGHNKDAKIMDIACGTGKAAIELSALGYKNIDGLDPSPEMLKIARSLNLYDRLLEEFIGPEPTPGIESNYYDGVVVCGGFAIGHLKAACIQEILRIIKPGSYFVSHSTKKYLESDYLVDLWDVIEKLCQEKRCELVKKEQFTMWENRVDTMFVLKKL